jgi:hypothetical protein
MFFNVDGGRSRISSSGTSHGAHHRRFLALMVGAPGSPAPAPPRGAVVDDFYVDGARSWISVSTRQGGGHHRCFLALMVGAPGSPALVPLRWPVIDVS